MPSPVSWKKGTMLEKSWKVAGSALGYTSCPNNLLIFTLLVSSANVPVQLGCSEFRLKNPPVSGKVVLLLMELS